MSDFNVDLKLSCTVFQRVDLFFFSSSNQFRTGIQDIGWLHADHEMAKLESAFVAAAAKILPRGSRLALESVERSQSGRCRLSGRRDRQALMLVRGGCN